MPKHFPKHDGGSAGTQDSVLDRVPPAPKQRDARYTSGANAKSAKAISGPKGGLGGVMPYADRSGFTNRGK